MYPKLFLLWMCLEAEYEAKVTLSKAPRLVTRGTPLANIPFGWDGAKQNQITNVP